MFAQPINLTAATTWTVTDAGGAGRTVTFNPAATSLYYRVKLASVSGGAGTEAQPLELLAHVAARLNLAAGGTHWHLTLDANGFAVISYTGAGTASVSALDASVAPCLGITATFGSLTNGGTPFTAPYHPTHVIYTCSRTDDTDWVPRPDTIGGIESDAGTVDVIRAGAPGMDRVFTFYGHPRTWAIRASRSAANSALYAPEAQWLTSTSDAATLAPPWSVHRFMHSSAGKQCACVFDYPGMIAGTVTSFYEFSFAIDTSRAKDPVRPTRPYFEELLNWGPVRLRFVTYTTLA